MKLIDGLNLYSTEDGDTVQAIALRHLNTGDLVTVSYTHLTLPTIYSV